MLDVIAPSALARVPGYGPGQRPNSIVALPGGTLNRSFRVDTCAGTFVLRLNDVAGVILGANHEREVRLHSAAALAGLAPELIDADATEGFIIMRHVPGASWRAAHFGSAEHLRVLGARLRTLHAIAPPAVAPFDLGSILRGHSASVIAAEPAERILIETLMAEADAALAACARDGRTSAIVHNDLHFSNLIEAERLYLIDWEYAAVADPIFDVACVLAYYPNAEPYAQLLLNAVGLETSTAVLTRARFAFLFLTFLWYRRRRLSHAVVAEDRAAEAALLQRLRA